MKWMKMLNEKLKGLTDAIARFPLTTLFLLGAAIVNAYMISSNKENEKLLLTFVVGAFLSAVAQVVYERFYAKLSIRFILMGVVAFLTAGYYLIIKDAPKHGMELEIRTAVALFALLIAFIWVPVIKSKISFNKSFMITFKSLFNSLFFSGVIFAGISIILSAINLLIVRIDYTCYPHTANIVFILFAPMYLLSLIPVYPGAGDQQKTEEDTKQQLESIQKAASCPKFLEILISYIIIPLVAVFTLILVIYIFKNIGGKFWTDNLLEPMLITYSITVILLYILASEIENKFTAVFRKIFPKVLVPIVLFQITSSFMSLSDTGVTHTRYYVILFGIYSAAAGLLLSFLPVRKNGVIAALLIVFAAVSIIPPVDAFTISKTSQIHTLKTVLEKNQMLENNKIIPKESLSKKDQQTISNAVFYLERMNYMKNVTFLPKDFNAYNDFYQTFGFKEYMGQDQPMQSIYLGLEQPAPIDINGSDVFVQTDISNNDKGGNEICKINKNGKTYILKKDQEKDQMTIRLLDKNNQELISYQTQQIFDKFSDYTNTVKGQISLEEATFTKENSRAKITFVVQNISIEKQNPQYNNAILYIFVQIK